MTCIITITIITITTIITIITIKITMSHELGPGAGASLGAYCGVPSGEENSWEGTP